MRTEWRPVNRYSGNAKKHPPRRERRAQTAEIDLEATVQEIFDRWEGLKDVPRQEP